MAEAALTEGNELQPQAHALSEEILYLRFDEGDHDQPDLYRVSDEGSDVDEVSMDWNAVNNDTNSYLAPFKDVLQERGISGLIEEIQRDINSWQDRPVQIAIVGETGTGKSSFINSIRNLLAGEKGAAKVDVVLTTTVIYPYPHPTHNNLIFWDIPGTGEPGMSGEEYRAKYLTKIEFEKYDFFILLSATRFKESELWLAKEIIKCKKQFYFARTKIDQDISNERYRVNRRSENEVKQTVRRDSVEWFSANGVEVPRIFLINNNNNLAFDFGLLIDELIMNAPTFKKEVLITAMSSMTEHVLQEKRKVLQGRIRKVAIASAISAAIPIPGVGMVIDACIIMREVKRYKSQFGTDDGSLQKIAELMNVPLETLIEDFEIRSSIILRSKTAFMNFCASIGPLVASRAAVNVITFVLPIGGILSIANTYPVSLLIQNRFLDMCYAEAIRVLEAKRQWMSRQANT